VIGPINRKNFLTFGGDPVSDTLPDQFSTSLTIAEYGILGDLLSFLSLVDFTYIVGETTHADKSESTTFCERSGIHPDSNLGSLLLEILTLVEVCAL